MSPPEKPKAPLANGSVPPIPVAEDACERADQISEYLDGTLETAAQAELLEHLPTCEPCQAVLHAEIQLRDREDELRGASAPGAAADVAALAAAVPARGTSASPVVAEAAPTTSPGKPAPLASLDEARAARATRAGRWKLPAGLAAAASLAATALFYFRPDEPPEAPTQLALAPTRSFEGRLAWSPAAGHRPYSVMRSSSATRPGELVDPHVVARLAAAKDCAGLGATYQLSGELLRAEQQYAAPECREQFALLADRAALAVAQDQFEEAIELADQVLAETPEHPVALWNRALALRGLGLGLAAAAAFEHIAKIDRDAGWQDEARTRAAALREPLDRARANWDAALAQGRTMVADGAPLPDALALAVPARARLRFHDAVRTATTAARLEVLRPLARTLESRGVAPELQRYLDAAKKKLSPARAALVPEYIELFQKQEITDEAAWKRWQERARAAGAEDLLLGAYFLTRPEDPETVRLAAATRDPWFIGLAAKEQVVARHAAGDTAGAEAQLAVLEKLCKDSGLLYLCLIAKDQRAELALDAYQPGAAAALAREALLIATDEGEFFYRSRALWTAGDGERKRKRSGVAGAYFEEYALSVESCQDKTIALALVADLAFSRHHFSETQRLLAALPKDCEMAPPASLLNLRANLAAAGLPGDRDAWLDDIRQKRQHPQTKDPLTWEYLELRASLRAEPSMRDRLRELIGRAAALEGSLAARVKVGAQTALVVESGRTGDWKAAFDVAAAAHGVATPARCALALASDDFRFAAVTVSATGAVSGVYQADTGPHARWKAPAKLAEDTAGCDSVSVLAFPPWHGIDPPLPPSMPWRFVLGPAQPEPAPSAAPEKIVVVASPTPPPSLRLPKLTAPPPAGASATVLSGSTATIPVVASAAAAATILEIHAHTSRVATSDAPAIALSEAPGGWALTAEEVSRWRFEQRPVVLLADCVGGVLANYGHVAWGLPAAFRAAGARAVVASLVDIPDGQAGEFFAAIREGLKREPNVERVVAKLRAEMIERDPSSWTRQVVVFQ